MENTILKGGEFLIKETDANDIFIPEEFNEEQKMIAQTCNDFLQTEVFPILERIDNLEEGLMRKLLIKTGELGLLGISIPEEYGGFEQSFVTSMLVNEVLGAGYSFSVAHAAHTGIGTLPILFYGNKEQKQKYLPKLATGELIACFCLTEPTAGSDANAGKTKALLSDDGKYYILNGQKMWITNSGFADIQIVFAKIEQDKILSAFIVEKKFDGITFSNEEKKMGIKGSSTRQIFYNDVKVPVENLLGKRGEGFRIALNILHIGRIKLAGSIIGAAKRAITHSVNYANERRQFGSLIADFGAIKYKLAEQVITTFATESAVYRASGNFDKIIQLYIQQGMEREEATMEAANQYALECAILKIFGSEALDYIVDEAVQIFGGMGFSAEMPVERAYRDSRINRIFEGTNEINRFVAIDALLKNALMKGGIDLFGCAKQIMNDLTTILSWRGDVRNVVRPEEEMKFYFGEKRKYISNFKKAVVILIATAYEKLKRKLPSEQEILMNLSDMIMYVYIAESTLLRVEKLEKIKNEEQMNIYKSIIDVFIYDSAVKIKKCASDAINSFLPGEEQNIMLNFVEYLTKVPPVNVKLARRRIADKLIEENRYNF